MPLYTVFFLLLITHFAVLIFGHYRRCNVTLPPCCVRATTLHHNSSSPTVCCACGATTATEGRWSC